MSVQKVCFLTALLRVMMFSDGLRSKEGQREAKSSVYGGSTIQCSLTKGHCSSDQFRYVGQFGGRGGGCYLMRKGHAR